MYSSWNHIVGGRSGGSLVDVMLGPQGRLRLGGLHVDSLCSLVQMGGAAVTLWMGEALLFPPKLLCASVSPSTLQGEGPDSVPTPCRALSVPSVPLPQHFQATRHSLDTPPQGVPSGLLPSTPKGALSKYTQVLPEAADR